jgi:hypothetical protein
MLTWGSQATTGTERGRSVAALDWPSKAICDPTARKVVKKKADAF